MYYQLPTGKVIEITLEQYLELTDEDIEYLIAYNHGNFTENPFQGSSLTNFKTKEDEEEITKEIPELTSEEKLEELDLDTEIDT